MNPQFAFIFRCLFAIVVSAGALRAVTVSELRTLDQADPAREERVTWHRLARFGCFVHWGVYADPAGEWPGAKPGTYSEHVMRWAKIPRQVYLEKVARPFNPAQFDADAWVKLMRDAGMRYLIITAKHHDGFAMYPSQVSDFNLTEQTAFKRDPLRELKDACAKYGLKYGFYYSHAFDWEHPDAPGNDWDYENPGGDRLLGGRDWWTERPEFLPNARRYVSEKSIPQIQELIRMYQPDILWFDTPHKLPPEENLRILAAVRTAGPDVVVNGRLVATHGDYKNTADRPAEVQVTAGHWEGIPTTNESYGYSRIDHSHKPPEHFIQLLAKSVSKGGNMLMNLGPKGDGTIDDKDAEILRGIGQWMQRHGESIHGADRTPLPVQTWGTSTRKDRTLYLHVFHWPTNGRLVVGGLKSNPTSARVLGALGAKLEVQRLNENDVEIAVAENPPDRFDSVIALEFADEIATNPTRYVPASGEATMLHVFDGEIAGGVRFGDGKRGHDVTAGFPNAGSVAWRLRLAKPGRFRVDVTYATATKDNASVFTLEAGDEKLSGKVTSTEGPTRMRTDTLGEIALPSGEVMLTVKPENIVGAPDLMRLRQVALSPVTP